MKRTHTVNGQVLPVFDPTKKKLLEKSIEKSVGDYAKKKGCLYWKFTSPSNRSVPDRIIITPNGVVGFLELKQKGKKPTEAQAEKLAELTAHNVPAGWADNVLDAKKFIDVLLTTKVEQELENFW